MGAEHELLVDSTVCGGGGGHMELCRIEVPIPKMSWGEGMDLTCQKSDVRKPV